MKPYFLLIILTMCFFLNSRAQITDRKSKAPKEDIKVNREYDEQGNLIRFDSVYTYNWSSDTTLMNSISPEDFPTPFGDHFGFFSDSTFHGNSFFDDFDQLFAQPFNGNQDSVLMQKFGMNPQFHNFRFNVDSLALNHKDFDDFFNNFRENKGDSISSGLPRKMPLSSQPKSMDEMMEMLQQHMQEMEEHQRKLLREEPEWQEF